MKRLASIVLALLLVAGSTVMLLAKPVFAQGNNGYVVSPVREELTIEKGQSQTVTLTVENATRANSETMALINDFEPSEDESGQPKILLDGSKSSGNSFQSLVGAISNITLGPLERKQVSVTISVPSDASAGGYYGAIRFIDAAQASDSNVALAASVGTIFLIQVPGDLKEQLELLEFTAAKNGSNGRLFINSGEISIVTRLRNIGNIHVKPYGKVTITDHSGKVIETYEFNNNEPRANVLPNSIRKFEDKLANQKWIGKYTVTANLGYGTTGSLITAKTTFWVIPSWIIIVFVVVLLGIIIGGYLVYHKYTQTKQHRNRIRRR